MNSRLTLPGLLALAVLAAGCDNDDDFVPAPVPPPPGRAELRIVHAVADAPSVDVVNPVGTIAGDVAFKDATAFIPAVEGTLTVQVDANTPGGPVTVIPATDLTIEPDNEYTVVAIGEAGSGTIEPLVIANPESDVTAGNVRVEVVHAAAAAPAVDIFVTAPGADLTQATPIAGGATPFGANSGQLEVPGGDYQIRVTLPGTTTPVFDSGTVSLPADADLLVLAVDNTGPGAAPITLLVSDGETTSEILDAATPAEVRVVHAVPDAPAVDVFIDDPMAAGAPALANLAFSEVQPGPDTYAELAAGTTNVLVTAAGNPGVIAIPATDLELEAGTQYSVYATGTFATIAPFVTVDDDRPIATEAQVRVLHMAPGAGLVDIYVTPPMTDISTVEPAFSDVDFLDDTGYVSLAGGSYDVTVTLADTTTAAIGPVTIDIVDGGVYTAAARDPNPAVMNDSFGLILMDDF